MGTELVLEATGLGAGRVESALDAAEAEMRRVEDLMTDWRPSPLTRLWEQAGRGPVEVPRELLALIATALDIAAATDGAFDVTYAGVGKLWDFKADPPRVPSDAEIERALATVGYQHVVVDEVGGTVDLPAGMRLGLGGIAKGYGVDRAMEVLLERGMTSAIVNAGGDMRVHGRKDGKPWPIAVKHPREKERVLAVVPLTGTSLVTSGDYERFFELDGLRYHHIIDPRTGRPSTGCISATVIGPHATVADALATALCVLGADRGLELIEGLAEYEALVVDMEGAVHVSSGLPLVNAAELR